MAEPEFYIGEKDPWGMARLDQLKQEAMDALRDADAFVVVAGVIDREHPEGAVLNIVSLSGSSQVDPMVFVAQAQVEVSDLVLRTITGQTGTVFEESDEQT